jgi:ABC-type transporter Mla maintaining outer membrane lipid asymmetry ATPase subunit MlaF
MVDVEKNSQSSDATRISLAWHGLTFQVNGKTILTDVSGQLASGQMLAVMGPSGVSQLWFFSFPFFNSCSLL